MKSDKAKGIGCSFNSILVTMTPNMEGIAMPRLTTLREVAGRQHRVYHAMQFPVENGIEPPV